MDNTIFANAVARIRVIENQLLDRSKIERLLDSSEPEEAYKILVDSGYGNDKDDVRDYSYENLLKSEAEKTFSLIKEISPWPAIARLFLIKNDYHNISAILKQEFMKNENKPPLIDSGNIPINRLEAMLRDRRFEDMDEIMKQSIQQGIDIFNRTGDPQLVDMILDRALYSQMSFEAALLENDFLLRLVKIIIDLINIKTYLRVKNMGKSIDFMERALLESGDISKGFFIEKYDYNLENFTGSLDYGPYGDICREGIEYFVANGSLSLLEKISDNYILKYINQAKFIALGPEPLAAYIIYKENEIRNVRIIMTGKINKINSEIIKERLREVYA